MGQQKIKGMVDSLRERDEDLMHPDSALDVLYRAQQAWYNLRPVREQRERCYRYTYGSQWSDKIKVGDEWITEDEYLRSIGQTPLQNNLIRRLVRTVLGVYRSQMKEPTCVARDREEQTLGDTMSTVLQCNWQRNRMKELNARTMEEFLVSGVIAHRKSYGRRNGICDCWTDYVNPSYFFFDSVMRDFRTWDVSMVGEIHDVSFEDLVSSFAKTKEDYDMLSNEYMSAKDSRYYGARYDRFFGTKGVNDFLIPFDPAVCRVIEVWTKENKSRYHCHDYADGTVFKIDAEDYEKEVGKINKERILMARTIGIPEEIIKQAQTACEYGSINEILDDDVQMPMECALITATPFIDSYWYFRYLTPTGLVLAEGETPYKHEGHPYVFRLYPFLNGEVHSFVDDAIDPQRYINRSMTQIDMIARASSKGVLMIPESSIPDGSSAKEMAEAWSKPTGVIIYKDDHGRNPKPVQENASTNTSTLENMLIQQQRMLEDGTGIHGAAQGKPGASSVSGVLYSQQAQNSTMTLLDMLDTFAGFEEECAVMDVKNIQQYYDDVRTVNIVGRSTGVVVYDPKKIKDVEYDIAIGESTSTPAYRQLAQDYYNQWLQAGMIDIEQALEFGNFPNADALLQSIRSKKEEAAQMQQQMPQGAPSKLDMPQDPTLEQPEIRPDSPLEKYVG